MASGYINAILQTALQSAAVYKPHAANQGQFTTSAALARLPCKRLRFRNEAAATLTIRVYMSEVPGFGGDFQDNAAAQYIQFLVPTASALWPGWQLDLVGTIWGTYVVTDPAGGNVKYIFEM